MVARWQMLNSNYLADICRSYFQIWQEMFEPNIWDLCVLNVVCILLCSSCAIRVSFVSYFLSLPARVLGVLYKLYRKEQMCF